MFSLACAWTREPTRRSDYTSRHRLVSPLCTRDICLCPSLEFLVALDQRARRIVLSFVHVGQAVGNFDFSANSLIQGVECRALEASQVRFHEISVILNDQEDLVRDSRVHPLNRCMCNFFWTHYDQKLSL